jgi:hypothetical protein
MIGKLIAAIIVTAIVIVGVVYLLQFIDVPFIDGV